MLEVIPEFFVDGQPNPSVLAPSFIAWQLQNDSIGENALHWTNDPQQTIQHAFLHAKFRSTQDVQPVIELKWDANKPSEVGLRLAKTPGNEPITRLKLRIIGGTEHLWRIIESGEQKLDSRKIPFEKKTDSSAVSISLDPVSESESEIQVNWQTDQSLPLQVLQRTPRGKPSLYSGVSLYRGLPLKFGARIPRNLDPSIKATRINQHPTLTGQSYPGGAVFDQIQIELKAKHPDWIWLQAQDRNAPPSR